MFFHFLKKATAVLALGRSPESSRRSSPLASQGLVAPPGLHGFHFSGGGVGAVTCQNKKKYPTLSAATSGVGEGGGRQLCVHEQFFGSRKRGKHSCVSSGSAMKSESTACRSAKKQSWSITVIVSMPYVPATSAHQSNSHTRVLWGEMFNVYSWSDGDFVLQKPLEFPCDLASNWGCKAPDNSEQCARAFWKQCS